MRNTKINGLPGFGLPSDMGEKGNAGTNVYFATIEYATTEGKRLGELDSSYLTYEYYFGREIPADKKIPMFNVKNKNNQNELFKSGDIIVVNLTRCCFFEVEIVEYNDGQNITKYAYIKNEQKYSLTLSPIKMINFSFSAAYSNNNGQKKIHIYPSLSTEKTDLIKYIDIEFISGNLSKHMRKKPSEFNGEEVSIPLENIFNGPYQNNVTINIYAVCNTHTMGMAEYFIGSDKVSF